MTTASKNLSDSPAQEPTIDMVEFGVELVKRRAAYEARFRHACELPRNSGLRRTESKRALLKAIEEAGGKW